MNFVMAVTIALILMAFRVAYVTYVQFRLFDAIHFYNVNIINANYRNNVALPTMEYDVVEEFWISCVRIWDWGYKRMVSPEVLEKIKPYINFFG